MRCASCSQDIPQGVHDCPTCGAAVPPDKRRSVELDTALVPGAEVLGKYRVEGLVERLARFEVYRAEHLILGRPLRIFLLSLDRCADDGLRERFVATMRQLGGLRDPGLLDIYEPFEIPGRVGAVCEVSSAPTLAHELDRTPDTPWNLQAIKSWTLPALRGLSKLHAVGLVHGRFGPWSMARSGPTVKLVDLYDVRLRPPSVGSRHTVDLDAARYQAPEWLASTGHVGPAADLYAVGCVLFRLATGEHAFAATGAREVIDGHLRAPLRDPADVRQGLPPGLVRIIQRAMVKHPSYRFESCEEMARALEAHERYQRPVPVAQPPWLVGGAEPALEPEPARPFRAFSLDADDAVDNPASRPVGTSPAPSTLPRDDGPTAPDGAPVVDGVAADPPPPTALAPGTGVVTASVDAPAEEVPAPTTAPAAPVASAPVVSLSEAAVRRQEPLDGLAPGPPPGDAEPPLPAPGPAPQATRQRPARWREALNRATEGARLGWRSEGKSRTERSTRRLPKRPQRRMAPRLAMLLGGVGLGAFAALIVHLVSPHLDDDVVVKLDKDPQGVARLLERRPGAGMVVVPGGAALLGADPGYADVDADQASPHVEDVAAFAIDVSEVTVGAYSACVAVGTCRAPTERSAGDDVPVVGVGWNDARAYCEWRGKRLPSESEWEKAARGTAGQRFPWGDAFACQRDVVNARPCPPPEGPQPATSGTLSASPYGVLHMAGNVWEWTNTPAVPGFPSDRPTDRGVARIVKGGDWASAPRSASWRAWNLLDHRSARGGFRCAQSVATTTPARAGMDELFGGGGSPNRTLDALLLGGAAVSRGPVESR